jgi:hypothetical protein
MEWAIVLLFLGLLLGEVVAYLANRRKRKDLAEIQQLLETRRKLLNDIEERLHERRDLLDEFEAELRKTYDCDDSRST